MIHSLYFLYPFRNCMRSQRSFIHFFLQIVSVTAVIERHRVHHLPNLKTAAQFAHFAGHIELQNHEKLFYWYTQSQQNPSVDPIVLWLNGGPGCSSISGFFTENGPFVVQNDGSVNINPYSWNRKVNLIWLEAPAGVGFSYPLQNASYYSDTNVAQRTYEFLQRFFENHLELRNCEFYITGESYAGIYIPFLVDHLMQNPISDIQFRGFAIGNPFTDNVIDGNALMDYYHSHALISLETYEEMLGFCKNDFGYCFYSQETCKNPLCVQALARGMTESNDTQFNPYYIYGDKCLLANFQGMALHAKTKRETDSVIGPCTDTFTNYYLNLANVQKAIHVDSETPVAWSACSDAVFDRYGRTDSALEKYRNILKKDVKILIYSGDADSVVNFMGTERWIGSHGLGLSIEVPWKAWFGPDQQHAGYVQVYKGLEFKTVKGAGHMVPSVRPLHGLYMFECYIFGDELCRSFQYPSTLQEMQSGLLLNLSQRQRYGFSYWIFAVPIAAMALFGFAWKRKRAKRSLYRPIL